MTFSVDILATPEKNAPHQAGWPGKTRNPCLYLSLYVQRRYSRKKLSQYYIFWKLHIFRILNMSEDNTNNSLFNWNDLPRQTAVPIPRVTQSITNLRGESAQVVRRAAGAAAQVASIISSSPSQVAAREKRVWELMDKGEAALTREKKQNVSLLVEGNTVREVKTTDETKQDVWLEYYIPLPQASADSVTYYSVEMHEQKLKVVDSAAGPRLDIGCSKKSVGLHELTTATEKTTSRLYEQMSHAADGDHVLHLVITALVQPADAMYNLPENSHFVYSIGDGVELHNVSAANPVQVPVFELYQEISKAYSRLYIQDSETKPMTVAPLLSNLAAATHHKLRNPNMLYSSLAFGIPLSLKVSFSDVKSGDLYTLINSQFKKDRQSDVYKCIYVKSLSIGKATETVVACIKHFALPSSRQDCKMFSFASFFNTLLKNGFFITSGGFEKCNGTSSAVKLTSPVLDTPNVVEFKKFKQTIIELLFTSTGKARYSWESFEKQVQALHDSGIPMVSEIVQDAYVLGLRGMLMNKPYDLYPLVECPLFNVLVCSSYFGDLSQLKRIVIKYDNVYSEEDCLDDDMAINTKDLLKIFLKEIESGLSDGTYDMGLINSNMLYLLLNAKSSYNFAEFVCDFASFLFQNCQSAFKFEDGSSDNETRKHSLAYFVVCFFSTMFVTCDLLCNCKEQNELGDVFIDGMLPHEYRSQPFTDLGPSIHKYAWSLYVEHNATQDCKLTGSNCPVYKNLNVSTFVRYFAFYGHLLDTSVEGIPDSAEDAVKYAKIFVDQISDNVKTYIQVVHPKNEVLFGQHLRNFVNHVQLEDSGSIFDVEKK